MCCSRVIFGNSSACLLLCCVVTFYIIMLKWNVCYSPHLTCYSGLFNSYYIIPWFLPMFPYQQLSAPPSSTVVLMSASPTAHPRLPSPPPTLRSPSWRTNARVRCRTWLTTRHLWTIPAPTLAQRRARTSSAMARTPSMTAPPGSSWWEGWWLAGALPLPPHTG